MSFLWWNIARTRRQRSNSDENILLDCIQIHAFNGFVIKESLKVGLHYPGDALCTARKTEGLLVTRKRLISAFLSYLLRIRPAAFRLTCFWLGIK